MDARTDKDKKSGQGKTETAILKETKSYLKPLMTMLKSNVCIRIWLYDKKIRRSFLI